ncbi:hypothetical protein TREMEDRAFT_27184 [Tremella mesenterica DSM 1558]|uniref:uncharacterized protein n=1 Tax=Tremella mesenterica (strain ATCC 24925 / CBS 8224 / DSM 1558 / NBRC 9311 / NRRL Y-6157 / RJB 2259-6 / UBC 559-6) TaxID=578456 RepID=UPI0003F4931C|nr:uncharacterized protein TREMEDRAFT_27184 [Tremella mesenterica DSM 1558]EIW71309.1 hypothetical protein TREMEDRAFT_27184 [Tremella mesenterica DSM 1558]
MILTGQVFADDKTNGVKEEDAVSATPAGSWKIHDRDCWYIEETGEIFTDYESYSTRRAFYAQPLFQCDVSGKSSMSYLGALANERREVRQLHTRFPRQLKKAVLTAVQFQIEGKLENLADKIFERFVNRFYDDEKVFVDVEGDKYLARIVKTFPPRSLPSAPPSPVRNLGSSPLPYHPFAADLTVSLEEVNQQDDPMKYFYSVRLIQEGTSQGISTAHSSNDANGHSNGGEDDGRGEKWASMVNSDKSSRDRINFSRAMLKRFIRDCVERDAAVYSPWMIKPPIARRYGLPVEMPPEVRERIQRYREQQMDKRKREREERLGITHPTVSEAEVEEEKEKPKTKKQRLAEEKKLKEEAAALEEENKRKKPVKYPAEDLLVEYSGDRDAAAGRIEARPAPGRTLPFGDQFERFLMTWSFLNVMGKPLGISPFPLDDFEQSLYHNDPWTSPAPLMTEIHAVLLNSLIRDLAAGTRGATTETLRPIAIPLSQSWSTRELSTRDGRKGWELTLIGCLWERASLDTLPDYLDNILHLTFEDKPAPTRPTWSTGPPQSTGHGLIPAKPDKRYSTLHHTHKLNIIAFLAELAAQTQAVREFLEESTTALTEVRKDQVEVRREIRRIHAELEALEPKEKPEDVEGETNGNDHGDVEGDDVNMEVKQERGESIDLSINANRTAVANAQREEAKIRRLEGTVKSAEKRRLTEEEEMYLVKLHGLEHDFRSHLYTLRARPMGMDRFGNKLWWMDGLGSAPLLNEVGKVMVGTGRVYLQGAEDLEVEYHRVTAGEVSVEEVEERRKKEEGEGRLGPGEWGVYDTPEQLAAFTSWLNPKGIRELPLLKQLRQWTPDIQAAMHRRRILAGLENSTEDEPIRRVRSSRRGGDEDKDGYLNWRVSIFPLIPFSFSQSRLRNDYLQRASSHIPGTSMSPFGWYTVCSPSGYPI